MIKKNQLISENESNEDELIAPREDNPVREEKDPIGKATDDEIAAWKTKYGRLFWLKGEGHICYVKKPSRKILGYAGVISTTKEGKSDTLKYFEVVLLNIFIGGSEEFKTNDKLLLGVGPQILELIEVANVELGEL